MPESFPGLLSPCPSQCDEWISHMMAVLHLEEIERAFRDF